MLLLAGVRVLANFTHSSTIGFRFARMKSASRAEAVAGGALDKWLFLWQQASFGSIRDIADLSIFYPKKGLTSQPFGKILTY
jgi:hypothetical protein